MPDEIIERLAKAGYEAMRPMNTKAKQYLSWEEASKNTQNAWKVIAKAIKDETLKIIEEKLRG